MNFGKRLISLRKERRLTREAFADILGISQFTLRNYELMKSEPNSDFLKEISNYFNVSTDYLLGVTEERERVSKYQLKESEHDMIKKFRSLSPKTQRTIRNLIEMEFAEAEGANTERP